MGSLKQDMKKELFMRIFEEDNYEQLCDAKAVPGETFVVEKSAKDELLWILCPLLQGEDVQTSKELI